jgi:glucosamine--fructose-6-phosphate aminotransferase (isomerizing)
MCQLAAYVGNRPIAPLLLRSLELQEPLFAGHATGLGVINKGELKIVKDSGQVGRVKKVTEIDSLSGDVGIAHSRYNLRARDDPRFNAPEMAHPFFNDDNDIALMHNGTIYNYKEHWMRLRENHLFTSYVGEIDTITDSEITVHMIDDSIKEGKSILDALRDVAPKLTGGFLLALITPDDPEAIWIANWYQPCVIAIGDDEAMFCSSLIGMHEIRNEVDRLFEPPRNSILRLTRGKVEIFPMDQGRKLYEWRMDEGKAADVILSKVKEMKEVDIRMLFDLLNPKGWAKVFGTNPESFHKAYRKGFRLVNEYFGFLDKLVASGFLNEKVDLRTEGGHPRTPRISYSLP